MALGTDLKAAWNTIKGNRAYLIVFLVVIGVIIYALYQRYKNTQAGTTSGNATTGQGYTIVNEYYQASPQGTPTEHPVPHDQDVAAKVAATTGVSTSTQHPPGSTFFGPTGVKHYVATGNENLSQIASHLGTGTWNSIYAIPDNQKLFGKLDYKQARIFTPYRGEVITIPGGRPQFTPTGA